MANDLRQIRRVHLSEGNSIVAKFLLGGKSHEMPVKDYNYSGMRIRGEGASPILVAGNLIQNIQIWFGNEQIGNYDSAIVRSVNEANTEFGVEFDKERSIAGMLRKHDRFDLDPDLRPLLSVNDPVFVGEVLHFVVEDISTSGIRLSTSLSNKHLLRGTIIKGAQLILPCIGSVKADLEVVWLKEEDEKLKIGIEYQKPSKVFIRDLLLYILFSSYRRIQTQDELIQFMRVSPFQIRAFQKALRVRIIESDEERTQMLYLRWISYYQAGKISGDLKPADMADEFDRYSTSYGVYLGRVMIGTFRFTPSKDAAHPFPFEKLMPFEKVKKFKREGRVEVSRMGILPEFQNSDVLLTMFEAVTREIIFSAKDLYIFTTSKLEQNYVRLGAIKLSDSVAHPVVFDETLTLYIIDRFKTLTGLRTSGYTWHLVMKRVYDFFTERGLWTTSSAGIRITVRMFFEKLWLKVFKGK